MKTNEELLGRLFDAVIGGLLAKIETGEAKPQDYAVAAKILKDNGIECLPAANGKMLNLRDALPSAQPLFGGPADTVQ